MTFTRAMIRPCRRMMLVALAVGLFGMEAANAVPVPAHIQNEIPDARLQGAGAFTWFGLKIYDAKFWVGKAGYRGEAPANGKLILDLQYARDLHGSRIAEASINEMKKIGIGTEQQHHEWLAKMTSLFPDVREGTQIAGVFLPKQGVRFYLNGAVLGEILDPEFAQAFFAIWLDPRTSDKKLRHALLAESSGK